MCTEKHGGTVFWGVTKGHWMVFKIYGQHFPSDSLQASLGLPAGQGL